MRYHEPSSLDEARIKGYIQEATHGAGFSVVTKEILHYMFGIYTKVELKEHGPKMWDYILRLHLQMLKDCHYPGKLPSLLVGQHHGRYTFAFGGYWLRDIKTLAQPVVDIVA